VWMARTARELIGARPHSYEPVFDEVVRWGWDRGHGGFYFQGKPGRPAGALKKQWWVQAEGLVAALTAGNSSSRYGIFEETLQWIERLQADWAGGEWHDTIDVFGCPRGKKGWAWKTGYHTTRSVLRAITLTQDLVRSDHPHR
ncbi:MAG: AGE family epimerase/isomerase, partial [Acidimicrobiia bacterium]|nr:AGE family epimerase/isomerase [Acidimicrobiia bacterium]NNL27115.1 hypothetical protein [Acidimicrobiia bacterium]